MDLPDFSDARIWAFFAAAAIVFGLAGFFGGKPERYGVLTLALMPLTQLALYSTVSSPKYGSLDWVALTADLIGLAGFTYVMMKADRLWPIAAFAMAVLSTLAHFARVNTDMLGFSYAQFKTVPTGLVILLLLVGTFAHQIRLRRHGKDRDWVPFKQYREFRRIAHQADL